MNSCTKGQVGFCTPSDRILFPRPVHTVPGHLTMNPDVRKPVPIGAPTCESSRTTETRFTEPHRRQMLTPRVSIPDPRTIPHSGAARSSPHKYCGAGRSFSFQFPVREPPTPSREQSDPERADGAPASPHQEARRDRRTGPRSLPRSTENLRQRWRRETQGRLKEVSGYCER